MLLAWRASTGITGGTIAGSRIDCVLQVDLFDDFRTHLIIGDDEDFRFVHASHLLFALKKNFNFILFKIEKMSSMDVAYIPRMNNKRKRSFRLFGPNTSFEDRRSSCAKYTLFLA